MLQLPRSSCFPVKMMVLVLPSAARPREKEREGTGYLRARSFRNTAARWGWGELNRSQPRVDQAW